MYVCKYGYVHVLILKEKQTFMYVFERICVCKSAWVCMRDSCAVPNEYIYIYILYYRYILQISNCQATKCMIDRMHRCLCMRIYVCVHI